MYDVHLLLVYIPYTVQDTSDAILGNRGRGGLGGIGAVFGGGEGGWDGIGCGGWGRGETKFVDGVGRGGGRCDFKSAGEKQREGKGREGKGREGKGGRPVG